MNITNVGALNVRGIKSKEERRTLARDVSNYNLKILALSETHITSGEEIYDITIIDTSYIP